jgi:hypothetical protein
MIPALAMAGAGALLNGVGAIIGGVAARKARKDATKLRQRGEGLMNEAFAKRSDYAIPDEIKNAYDLSENRAFAKSGVQSALEKSADQTLSNNLSAVRRYATSSNDALAAASGAYGANQQSYNDAAVAGAQDKQQNMAALYDQASQMGSYKNLMYDMNVNVPYLQRLEFAQGMIGAGFQGEQNSRMASAQIASNAFSSGGNSLMSYGLNKA